MARKSSAPATRDASPAQLTDARIRSLGDWRGRTLSRVRELIREADPAMAEEWKWVKPSSPGVPVWSHDGIVCTGEVYKDKVKMTFAKGTALEDPAGLFNSSLDGNVRRAIDFREGDAIDERALKALIRAAVALNASRAAGPKKARKASAASAAPKLLSGGNPQVAKGDGDAPVQAYLAAMPGWKRDVGRRLDALVARTVPDVRKAVKWNSPFYGVDGRSWFLNFHCFAKYVKVAFFRGASLHPLPPGASKQKDVRYLDVHEGDTLDEELVASWIRQASKLPGWVP